MDIVEQIRTYVPVNEQEERDREVMLSLLQSEDDLFERSNTRHHMTASAWVTDETGKYILMAYHNIYDSWSWLGGHADGERDLLATAMREVTEESGLRRIRPASEELYSLEILTVDGHEKKGKYVSSHLHLNVTYLLIADRNEPLRIKEDENKAVAWFGREDAIKASNEKWFRERIYRKLNDKLDKYVPCPRNDQK